MFQKLSDVNHSCRPNAERKWNLVRNVEVVYEEITVSYVAGLDWLETMERRRFLQKGWRFECDFERCGDGVKRC